MDNFGHSSGILLFRSGRVLADQSLDLSFGRVNQRVQSGRGHERASACIRKNVASIQGKGIEIKTKREVLRESIKPNIRGTGYCRGIDK